MLRDAQKDALLKMLNLNQESDDSPDAPIVWKVLIYDKYGQDIISPVLRLGELRSAGVTLHLPLLGDRQPIPDVPAVYFVQPTLENIQIIAKDLQKRLYDSIYVNFTSALTRPLMEDFAAAAVQSNSTALVSQVYDQYLNYICLENNLFSLEIPKTYQVINDVKTSDSVIEKTIEDIASALFSVIVTTGNVPIIKCQKRKAAEAVARKLDAKLRDNLMNSRTNLFSDKIHMNRPGIGLIDKVLILLDRDIDLATMLTHSWSYACLFHDLLEMKLNRVEERGRQVKKTYDIDVTDEFWSKNASLPLPEVGMFIDTETKNYKEIVNSVGAAALEDTEPTSMSISTQALSTTIEKLPELRQKQKVLDMHTVLATSLLNTIVSRQLDSFISMEESIGKLNTATILEVIKDPAKNSEDKLRLFLIYALSVGDIPKSELNDIENALKLAGCDVTPIEHIKQVKADSKMNDVFQQQQYAQVASATSGDLLGSFTSNFSKLTESFQSAGIGEKFGNIISGVKNLLPARKELPVTRAVEAIMNGSTTGTIAEDYLTFDPKLPKNSNQIPKLQQFTEALVFVVGGGNYIEYMNVLEHCQRSGLDNRKVMYGSTEILSSRNFISQLSEIGGTSLD